MKDRIVTRTEIDLRSDDQRFADENVVQRRLLAQALRSANVVDVVLHGHGSGPWSSMDPEVGTLHLSLPKRVSNPTVHSIGGAITVAHLAARTSHTGIGVSHIPRLTDEGRVDGVVIAISAEGTASWREFGPPASTSPLTWTLASIDSLRQPVVYQERKS